MTAGYPYGYQQSEGSTAQTRTREVMEVDVLAFAAGNGGVKQEEEEVGVKDSLSTRAKTVEGPAYTPSVPATALTPGWIEAQAQPAEPFKR